MMWISRDLENIIAAVCKASADAGCWTQEQDSVVRSICMALNINPRLPSVSQVVITEADYWMGTISEYEKEFGRPDPFPVLFGSSVDYVCK